VNEKGNEPIRFRRSPRRTSSQTGLFLLLRRAPQKIKNRLGKFQGEIKLLGETRNLLKDESKAKKGFLNGRPGGKTF